MTVELNPDEAQAKMSDEHWMRAMQKYAGLERRRGREDELSGGAFCGFDQRVVKRFVRKRADGHDHQVFACIQNPCAEGFDAAVACAFDYEFRVCKHELVIVRHQREVCFALQVFRQDQRAGDFDFGIVLEIKNNVSGDSAETDETDAHGPLHFL